MKGNEERSSFDDPSDIFRALVTLYISLYPKMDNSEDSCGFLYMRKAAANHNWTRWPKSSLWASFYKKRVKPYELRGSHLDILEKNYSEGTSGIWIQQQGRKAYCSISGLVLIYDHESCLNSPSSFANGSWTKRLQLHVLH